MDEKERRRIERRLADCLREQDNMEDGQDPPRWHYLQGQIDVLRRTLDRVDSRHPENRQEEPRTARKKPYPAACAETPLPCWVRNAVIPAGNWNGG